MRKVCFWARTVATGLVTAVCLCAAERDTAEWVLRQGGRVMLDGERRSRSQLAELPSGDVWLTGVDLVGTTITPKELERLGGLAELRELYLPGASWTPGAGSKIDENSAFKHLAGLKKLERLEFSLHFLPYFNITDAAFFHIEGLTQLRELRCEQCRVKGEGLASFVNMQSLDLSYSAVSDEGMASVGLMKGLRRLYLRDTLITDAGLKQIAGLTQLEELDLYGTKVTDAGVAELRQDSHGRKRAVEFCAARRGGDPAPRR